MRADTAAAREAEPAAGPSVGLRSRALDLGRRLGARAIAVVYPPSCMACEAATASAHALCPACWRGIGFIERPFCDRLGTPFTHDGGEGLLSPAAIADPPVFARARAVARYEGTARDLVHRLKYGDRPDLARAMGGMMARSGGELLEACDLIVPVPLHRWRLWSRRYNQAMALARRIAELSGRPVDAHALARVKGTRQQARLSRAQRQLNLQGAFKVLPEQKAAIDGRRVLLVDDVLTTGSTANAASRALLRAGAQSVDVLTFAMVVPGEA